MILVRYIRSLCVCKLCIIYIILLYMFTASFPNSFLPQEINDASGVGSIDVPIRLGCHTQTECEIAPCMHAATMDSAFIHIFPAPSVPRLLKTRKGVHTHTQTHIHAYTPYLPKFIHNIII